MDAWRILSPLPSLPRWQEPPAPFPFLCSHPPLSSLSASLPCPAGLSVEVSSPVQALPLPWPQGGHNRARQCGWERRPAPWLPGGSGAELWPCPWDAMGTRGPCALVDTTPAKTILVYRNGDQFSVGRKFVLPQRGVATFEALLEQLTERVEVPFGVRRLYTPTHGSQVCELPALQAGGKYVAAGREPFKKLE